jgi:hypothetical protein
MVSIAGKTVSNHNPYAQNVHGKSKNKHKMY